MWAIMNWRRWCSKVFSTHSRLVWKPYGHNTRCSRRFISFHWALCFFSSSFYCSISLHSSYLCMNLTQIFSYRFLSRASTSSHWFFDFLVSVAFSLSFGILSRVFGELTYFCYFSLSLFVGVFFTSSLCLETSSQSTKSLYFRRARTLAMMVPLSTSHAHTQWESGGMWRANISVDLKFFSVCMTSNRWSS